jgi:hypothetical protein
LKTVRPVLPAKMYVLSFAVLWGTANADCIDQAAQHQGVNAYVLRAIGWHESRLRPQAVARNRNGTWDIGAFQINSMHLGALARHGIDAQALSDGCTSAHVAAWHYARQVALFGNTWRAVGAYHSHTPARSAWYANAIAQVLMGWGVLPGAALPFDPASTLSPRQATPGAPRAPASDTPTPVTLFDAGLVSATAGPVTAPD